MDLADYSTVKDASKFSQRCDALRAKIDEYRAQGRKPFLTSSFQSQSLPLLHMVAQLEPKVPVYFLDTGFLFPETLSYRDQIGKLLNLDLCTVRSEVSKVDQRNSRGGFYFTSDPDYCCYLNKTQVTDKLLREYDVWISGVRRDQSAVRKAMAVEAPGPHNTTRFHPMLDWTGQDVNDYIQQYELPRHPLESQGYLSIGCEPCTAKFLDSLGEVRDSRWKGLAKKECGLHTELVKK